jgi:hypothetical protein
MEAPQRPAGGDTTNAIPGLIGVTILFALTLVVYGFRMYTRIRPTFRLATTDYIITVALVSISNRFLILGSANVQVSCWKYSYTLA